ncbi:CLUMA_CG008798, isoform A [Clunio marinus]|uniref:CLUMA_CG008798, isoform A n=1 Tax=Clunio marinus TaxID=568069 RepID=A0A1J1I9V3_9DIPT|nr:CLUMA_CG008798, isoform A [Clunio marinus]
MDLIQIPSRCFEPETSWLFELNLFSSFLRFEEGEFFFPLECILNKDASYENLLSRDKKLNRLAITDILSEKKEQ